MKRTALLATLLFTTCTTFVATNSRAQESAPTAAPTAADLARSEGAFKEAQVLLDAGHVAEACPKFVESQRLAPGVGVTLYLADCYERMGRTASAWREFKRAEQMAVAKKDSNRTTIAKQRAATLEPQLSMLTIEVPPAARVPGLKLKDEGTDVADSTWGKASASDAGPHVVVATAPGHKRREFNVVVPPNKGTATLTVVPLEEGEDGDAVAEVPKEKEPAPPPVAATAPRESGKTVDSRQGNTQRLLGMGVGAAGVVATGVGVVFGVMAKSSLDESNEPGNCRPDDMCTQNGLDLRSDASSSATVSTVLVGVGLAALVGGVILYVTAPRASSKSATHGASNTVAIKPMVLPTPTGVLVRF